jgi:hypothetical protein
MQPQSQFTLLGCSDNRRLCSITRKDMSFDDRLRRYERLRVPPNEPSGGFLYDCVKRINKEVSTSESTNQILQGKKTTETYFAEPFLESLRSRLPVQCKEDCL